MLKKTVRIITVVLGLAVCVFALTAQPFSRETKSFFVVMAVLIVGAIWRATKPADDGKTLVVRNPVEGKVFETHIDTSYGSSGERASMGGFHVYFTEGTVTSPVEGELTYFASSQAQVRTANDILVVIQCPFEPTTYEPADVIRIGEQVKVGTPLMRVAWDRQAQMHVASVMLEHMGVGVDVLVNRGSVTMHDTKGVVAAGKPVMTVTL